MARSSGICKETLILYFRIGFLWPDIVKAVWKLMIKSFQVDITEITTTGEAAAGVDEATAAVATEITETEGTTTTEIVVGDGATTTGGNESKG